MNEDELTIEGMPASELIDEEKVEESYTPTYNNYTGHS